MVSVAIFSPGLKHPGLFFVCTEGVSNVRHWYFQIFIKFMGGAFLELEFYKVWFAVMEQCSYVTGGGIVYMWWWG